MELVIDLYSRRVIGFAQSKRMSTDLISRALMMAIRLRGHHKGLIFHSDRGSQYTSKNYQSLLTSNGLITSMSGIGACYDNAVVERFFGSLKNEWLYFDNNINRH